MAERGFQAGVTFHHVERVGIVGHRLQLGHRGLRRAPHVVHVEGALLIYAVAEAHERGKIPYPPFGDVFIGGYEVLALAHRWNE